MKHLVGKDVTKEVDFMNDKVTIRKLNTGRILEVQKAVQEMNKKSKGKDDDDTSLNLIRIVIRNGVIGANELKDEDFLEFPLDEINKLVESILGYSGLSQELPISEGN